MLFQFFDYGRVLRVLGEVFEFVGITGEFVELRFARNQAGHAEVIIQYRLKEDTIHLTGHQRGLLPLGIRVFQERNQAVSVERLGRLRQAEQLNERRIEIEQ